MEEEDKYDSLKEVYLVVESPPVNLRDDSFIERIQKKWLM